MAQWSRRGAYADFGAKTGYGFMQLLWMVHLCGRNQQRLCPRGPEVCDPDAVFAMSGSILTHFFTMQLRGCADRRRSGLRKTWRRYRRRQIALDCWTIRVSRPLACAQSKGSGSRCVACRGATKAQLSGMWPACVEMGGSLRTGAEGCGSAYASLAGAMPWATAFCWRAIGLSGALA